MKKKTDYDELVFLSLPIYSSMYILVTLYYNV